MNTPGTPQVSAGLAALQRTHEVYRKARERAVGAGHSGTALEDGTESEASRKPQGGARELAERDLAESLRTLRAVQAGQAVAARHAAEERQQLEAALREAKEAAAQQVSRTQCPSPLTAATIIVLQCAGRLPSRIWRSNKSGAAAPKQRLICKMIGRCGVAARRACPPWIRH